MNCLVIRMMSEAVVWYFKQYLPICIVANSTASYHALNNEEYAISYKTHLGPFEYIADARKKKYGVKLWLHHSVKKIQITLDNEFHDSLLTFSLHCINYP